MKLEHLVVHLNGRGIEYVIGNAVSTLQIAQVEAQLNITLPAQVRLFYGHYNGLKVEQPPLEMLALHRLSFIAPDRLHFATFNWQHRVCFDTSQINSAGQWCIVSVPDEYRITFTIASFWSNKIWHWIDYKRPVWTRWEQ